MATRKTDYLIVGNSAAGCSAADAIRETAPNASITILGDEPYPAYGRPLISYMIEGKTDEEHIWLKDQDYYTRNNYEALLGPEFAAVSIDPKQHGALLENGETVEYGKCLLATGSVPFIPPIKGLSEGANVHTFMNLDDAKGLWASAEELSRLSAKEGKPTRIVVVGAGLIGLKAAEAISRFADEVLVLELAPRILPAVLDSEGASILQRRLEREGITCMPGISAEEFILEGDIVTGARLTNGEFIDCDIVVAAVGVRPNSSLAVNAGAEQGRGLICDESLQTTLPDVYAAGDIVQVHDVLDGSLHPLALWPNAVQQGREAGLHMAGASEAVPYKGGFAVNAVDFYDYSLLTSGVINPPEDASLGYEVDIRADGDSYAKFIKKDGKLVGYILLNRPENAGIYTSLIDNGIMLSSLDESIFDHVPENMQLDQDHRWNRLHKGYPSDRDHFGRKKAV